MTLDRAFNILSYAVVVCGFVSLWATGTLGIAWAIGFPLAAAAAFYIEGTRLQLSERAGTAMIILIVPLFYVGWRWQLFGYGDTGALLAGILARLILSMSVIKLLQKKADRDWIFLYIMAFFEVLLSAGLSISAFYLLAFIAFALAAVCAIVLLEIRKADTASREKFRANPETKAMPFKNLPGIAVVLLLFIAFVAGPLFFMLPRAGGAGLGGDQGGVSNGTGFSDTVQLGDIGRLQQNDQTVMRVRVEESETPPSAIKWRGIALDHFDNRSWTRTMAGRERRDRNDKGFIQLGTTTDRNNLVAQTVYLEPLDTAVIFALPKVVAVQGNFQMLFKDAYGAISFPRSPERITYRVLSDEALPPVEVLRRDNGAYPIGAAPYLQLPDKLDPRIEELAQRVVSGGRSRYDAARAVERYLQNDFGYTLEMKAGGEQPLADFLFNVREGHCEYFASAMAVMLRTQGIATRVVNGFSRGEYNEPADVYIVKQRNAHSWVEVYFPSEDAWVAFDPTPPAGQDGGVGQSTGVAASLSKYMEALEMFWIQYFVAFDNQEQRSLFTSARKGLSDLQSNAKENTLGFAEALQKWWSELSGEMGSEASDRAVLSALGAIAGILLLGGIAFVLYKAAKKKQVFGKVLRRLRRKRSDSVIEFYEQMSAILAEKGVIRPSDQTPVEFAHKVKHPSVVRITELYNRVRFGGKKLSSVETGQINEWLEELNLNV